MNGIVPIVFRFVERSWCNFVSFLFLLLISSPLDYISPVLHINQGHIALPIHFHSWVWPMEISEVEYGPSHGRSSEGFKWMDEWRSRSKPDDEMYSVLWIGHLWRWCVCSYSCWLIAYTPSQPYVCISLSAALKIYSVRYSYINRYVYTYYIGTKTWIYPPSRLCPSL